MMVARAMATSSALTTDSQRLARASLGPARRAMTTAAMTSSPQPVKCSSAGATSRSLTCPASRKAPARRHVLISAGRRRTRFMTISLSPLSTMSEVSGSEGMAAIP